MQAGRDRRLNYRRSPAGRWREPSASLAAGSVHAAVRACARRLPLAAAVRDRVTPEQALPCAGAFQERSDAPFDAPDQGERLKAAGVGDSCESASDLTTERSLEREGCGLCHVSQAVEGEAPPGSGRRSRRGERGKIIANWHLEWSIAEGLELASSCGRQCRVNCCFVCLDRMV